MNGGWDAPRTRRQFLGLGALVVGSVIAAPALAAVARAEPGGGRLIPDPGGVIDLPPGFRYRIVSTEAGRLTGGQSVPGDFDGMAAFPGPGGTTAVVVGPDRREVRSHVLSSGTRDNCAGGATPWGTWLTCEEDRSAGHGFVFEVDPADPEGDRSRTPIRDMGRFSHEAVGVDPRTGIAYLTEDETRRGSFLYRYTPHDRRGRPGSLGWGGTLEALAVDDPAALTVGRRAPVRWVPVRPADANEDARARGAAPFGRLEGATFGGGSFWFDDTAGGASGRGQVYRLVPGPGGETLERFIEAAGGGLDSPDNVVVTPFGDLWFAEDGGGVDRLMGVTPEGGVYEFARNRITRSEFCGPCFAPDGRTLFVNIQNPGLTLAIWGPFPAPSAARRRQMAQAAPPAPLCTPA